MMHHNAVKSDRPPSIIATLNQGFQTLNRRWWIVIVPVVVNLIFWLGPQISPQPLAGNILDSVRQMLQAQGQPQVQANLDEQLKAAMDSRQGIPFDLRTDTGWTLSLLAPIVGRITTPASPLALQAWHVGSVLAFVGVVIAVNVVGLLLGALYLVLLGNTIRNLRPTVAQIVSSFIRMMGVIVVWIAVAVIAAIPFLVIGGVLGAFVEPLGELVVLAGTALILWMVFTAQFAFDAVVITDENPFRALLGSVLVVRRWFWSAIGLFILTSLIGQGMTVIWQALANLGALGLLVAIVGSAYISAGLATAHLIFYRDRVQPIRLTRRERVQ